MKLEHIVQIVDIAVQDIMKRLKTMNMSLELTKSAKEFLAEKGYDPAFGARPLKRAVQKYLEEPLSEEILKGRFTSGSVI